MDIEIKLLKHQKEFITSESKNTLLLAGRACGKSYIASILSAMRLVQGEKGLVFAQSYGALSKNLFKEICDRLTEWNVDFNYNKTSMVISCDKGLLYGYSYENIEAVRGLSGIAFAVCDEIALAPEPDVFFGAVAPCLRGRDIVPKMYFMTTPRGGSAWNEFFKERSNDNSWNIITATTFDNTFLTKESIDLMTSSLEGDMLRQELYGDLLDMKVENSVFDIDKIVKAPLGDDDNYHCGIDFARYGVDKTVFVIRNSFSVIDIISFEQADTARLVDEYKKLNARYKFIDTHLDSTGGFDIGFYDTLKNTNKEIREVNFGASSPDQSCANNRAYIYMRLANALENGFHLSDKERDIIRALKYTTWTMTGNGKKQLAPKDRVKRILGHSPDAADALALTFYNDAAKRTNIKQRQNEVISFLFR